MSKFSQLFEEYNKTNEPKNAVYTRLMNLKLHVPYKLLSIMDAKTKPLLPTDDGECIKMNFLDKKNVEFFMFVSHSSNRDQEVALINAVKESAFMGENPFVVPYISRGKRAHLVIGKSDDVNQCYLNEEPLERENVSEVNGNLLFGKIDDVKPSGSKRRSDNDISFGEAKQMLKNLLQCYSQSFNITTLIFCT